MQLTRYSDYSLRVLMYLALHDGRRVTISEIAEKFSIPRAHLMKVVHNLSSNSFITTYQGKNGGMRLARPAADINVGSAVRATETSFDAVDCDDPPCPMAPSCELRPVLDEAMSAFLSVLDRQTVADLTKRPGDLMRLVE